MKILGEKSYDKLNKFIKFFTINPNDKNTIRTLTNNHCKVYHLNCSYVDGNFVLSEDNWISSRRICDALSQINQYSDGVFPYVQISCDSEDVLVISKFIDVKAKWSNSFKKLIIL